MSPRASAISKAFWSFSVHAVSFGLQDWLSMPSSVRISGSLGVISAGIVGSVVFRSCAVAGAGERKSHDAHRHGNKTARSWARFRIVAVQMALTVFKIVLLVP